MQFPIFPKLIVCGIVDIWWGAVTTATLGDTVRSSYERSTLVDIDLHSRLVIVISFMSHMSQGSVASA